MTIIKCQDCETILSFGHYEKLNFARIRYDGTMELDKVMQWIGGGSSCNCHLINGSNTPEKKGDEPKH